VIIMIALSQAGDGQMTVGGFASFITAMLMTLTPLKHLAAVNGPLQRGLAAGTTVFGIIDAMPEREHGRDEGSKTTHGHLAASARDGQAGFRERRVFLSRPAPACAGQHTAIGGSR
jgi:ABC-type multidrug transport system fused ATPase/permease subunit